MKNWMMKVNEKSQLESQSNGTEDRIGKSVVLILKQMLRAKALPYTLISFSRNVAS